MTKIKTLGEFKKQWKLLKEEIRTRPNFNDFSDEAKQKRIIETKDNFLSFAVTYFPEYFKIPFATFHKEWNKKIIPLKNEIVLLMAFRGSGKSTLFDLILPVWLILTKQENFGFCISYTVQKSKIFVGRILLELLYNPRLKQDYDYRIVKKSLNDVQITVDNDFFGCVMPLSIKQDPRGSVFLSHRPGFAVLDDIQNRKLAKNKNFVKNIIEYIYLDLLPAFKKDFRCYILATPVNSKDVCFALKNGIKIDDTQFEAVKTFIYPAIIKKNGKDVSSWLDRWTLEELLRQKKMMGEMFFNQEFQLIAINYDGSIFRREWFKYLPKKDINNINFDCIVASIDFSNTKTGDYKALIITGIKEGIFYVIDSFIRKTTNYEVLKKCYYFFSIYKIDIFLYEDCTEDKEKFSTLEELWNKIEQEKKVRLPREPIRNTQNKVARVSTISTYYERGEVIHNSESKDIETLEEQLVDFPTPLINDDGPDALEMGIRKLLIFMISFVCSSPVSKKRNQSITEGYDD
ncbi:MAG TPA: hypothetical protein PK771_06600 [Spirochaetota bacterium]|nr:hypothetical protein [Spirochaetota bacterium]